MESATKVTTQNLNYEASILLVDDDPELRQLVIEYLDTHGFRVTGVHDGQKMDEHLSNFQVDLLILDLHLPGEDGISIARRISVSHRFPVIILSNQGEDIDRIVGLEAGADDYLPKPFNPRELLARIRALLRRVPNRDKHRYTFGDIVFHCDAMMLVRNGQKIKLTKAESSMLKVFCDNPDCLLTRDDMLQHLKGYDRMPDDRSIDVGVTRLRRKISQLDNSDTDYIYTVWGKGYKFLPPGNIG